MKLLFYPDPPSLRWCKEDDGRFSTGKTPFGPDCFEGILGGDAERVDLVATLLHNGGDEIVSPVTAVDSAALGKARDCVKLMPDHNDMSVKTAEYWLGRLPKARHEILCDTAFFSTLPPEASTYAVPYSLRKEGIKRYGGYGLCHQSAWRTARRNFGDSTHEALSVYLGDSSNVAAIRDGGPIETSIGFTSIEGIISSGGCGDMDPTVVLQLASDGVSQSEMNELLTKESGMSGLLGRKCPFDDLLDKGRDAELDEVRRIFAYQIVKTCGAFVSVMGGVDTVLFSCADTGASDGLIREICGSLGFLGLKLAGSGNTKGTFTDLTGKGSRIHAASIRYNEWEVMSEMAKRSD